ncbi:MAG TPA: methyltransferase domain-containing protein [Bryobacteraceae bacterium]|jgi:SAM-dependent methyltransferase/uncharacterized protein YbaR (Trm112 family)|nr:methyltransferase domain-containing protein [Bryobacteraceae bacterium]
MHKTFEPLLVCPVCHSKLNLGDVGYICQNNSCKQEYPLISRVPILVNELVSTFKTSAYRKEQHPDSGKLRKRIRSLVPRISVNLAASKKLKEFAQLLLLETPSPRVLVLGGAEVGVGMNGLLQNERIQCLESDIVIGPRTEIVFDASYIPLETESVDGVVIQAVLEYIPDPARAVAEIHRVLKPRGIVYSEMPFMQHVHGGRYDFTRLTHLGHLRMYRHFAEIRSGACAGPATALAWALQHFFLSFVRSPWQRDLTKVGTGFLFFWLKYFDYLLAHTPGGLDAATGTFLLARKTDQVIPDRELISRYRGAVPITEIL